MDAIITFVQNHLLAITGIVSISLVASIMGIVWYLDTTLLKKDDE